MAQHECWIDGEYAHPVGTDLYEVYLDQAVAWGVETFEHDWLVECFLGVRGLREAPGRALAWQQGLDAALARRGMTAQWCMATPADMMATTTLGQVTSIRTSGDHGYLVPPELLWAWFLYTNALVRPLGLWPYKDVFRSDGHGGSTDPGAEAALAALSGGPVGIGDALGGADRELVLRTARRDGLLVAPDAPVAAIARCFARHGVLHPEPVVGATHTRHTAGRWSYVITMNCHADTDSMATDVPLTDLGADAPADADATRRCVAPRAWSGAPAGSRWSTRAGPRWSSVPRAGTCGCWRRCWPTDAWRCSAMPPGTSPRVASACPRWSRWTARSACVSPVPTRR